MSDVAHPNMFPGAGESVAIAARDDEKLSPNADQDAGATSGPTSPWANPLCKLKATDAPKDAPAPAAGPKEKPQTRAEQVIEYLRANGPTGSKQLCIALGLSTSAGIMPLIDTALKAGRIVRVNHLYMLPEQRPVSDVRTDAAPSTSDLKAEADASPTVGRAPEPASTREAGPAPAVMENAVPAIEPPRIAPAQRKPDFTLAIDQAMLTVWPDGRVTVRADGVFVELTPQQAKPLRILVEARI